MRAFTSLAGPSGPTDRRMVPSRTSSIIRSSNARTTGSRSPRRNSCRNTPCRSKQPISDEISAPSSVFAMRARVSSRDGNQHASQRYVVTYPPTSPLKYGRTWIRDSGTIRKQREQTIWRSSGSLSVSIRSPPLQSARRSSLADRARYFQKSAKPRAAAAHRRAVQRVAGKPRQKARNRDRAFEPRQRHAGALVRAGGKGEVPVGVAGDVEIFRVGELSGIAVGGADAQRHRRARDQRDAAEFDLFGRHAIAELVRAFEAQVFRRMARQRHQPVADQIGGGLVAGVEQEDAVVQQFLFRQPLAIVLAFTLSLDQAGQDVALGVAWVC